MPQACSRSDGVADDGRPCRYGESVTEARADNRQSAIIAAAVLATIPTILPAFLVGALSVQISADFDVSEAIYGWGIGGFFLAAMVGSIRLGRIAQRVGPRRQVTYALVLSGLAQVFIAVFAQSFLVLVLGLAFAGLCNSANQTGINLLLSQAKLPRLGLAMALKQSGMPAASLLGGLAVPAIALTVGWRWAYVLGAMATLLSVWNVRRVIEPVGRMTRTVVSPTTPRSILAIAAIGTGFLAFSAGALNAWIVSSGVEAGISAGWAGLLLSGGATCGIAVRLGLGFRLDTMAIRPFTLAGLLSLVGALGVLLLTIETPATHLIATLLAFGVGWVWPVFTNFGIVRANLESAGAATGVTQTGVYIGVFSGPLVTGWIIERAGYSTMWAVVAIVMTIGAVVTLYASRDF